MILICCTNLFMKVTLLQDIFINNGEFLQKYRNTLKHNKTNPSSFAVK